MNAPSSSAPWQQHRLVFVGGLHRSGTTLLAQLISGASGASGLTDTGAKMDEGQHLQDVFLGGRALGGPTRWAFDRRAHLTDVDARATPDAARRLWESWSPYWDLGATHLVEKTPLNLTKTLYLQELFPEARFVIITRHPVSQAVAVWKWMSSGFGWSGLTFHQLVRHWLVAHDTFREDHARLRNVMVISYERLLQEPGKQFAEVSGFLGLPAGTDQLGEVRAETLTSYANEWKRLASGRGPSAPRPGWKGLVRRSAAKRTIPHQARQITARYASQIALHGYRVDDLVSPPALPYDADLSADVG